MLRHIPLPKIPPSSKLFLDQIQLTDFICMLGFVFFYVMENLANSF